MTKFADLVEFRVPKEDELPFILSSWFKSFRKSPWAGTLPNNLYHNCMKELFDQLVERGMYVYVAAASTDPDQLLGFIAFEEATVPVVHYVFVKDKFRKQGIGSALMRQAGASADNHWIYTHRTEDSKRFRGGKHVPAIARRKELEPVYGTR